MALIPYNQALQQGGYFSNDDLRVFSGSAMQRGSGLGTVLKGFLKSVAPMAKRAAISLGKNALSGGINIAQDLLNEKNFKQSVKHRLKDAGLKFTKDMINEFEPSEAGLTEPSEPPAKIHKVNRSKHRPVRSKKSSRLTGKGKKRAYQDIFS